MGGVQILEKKHNNGYQKNKLLDFLTYFSLCFAFKDLMGIKEGGERTCHLFQSLSTVCVWGGTSYQPNLSNYHLGLPKGEEKAAKGQ